MSSVRCGVSSISVGYFVFSQMHNLLLQLTKSKHYCGICKKIWNHSDSGSWVRQYKNYIGVAITFPAWMQYFFLINLFSESPHSIRCGAMVVKFGSMQSVIKFPATVLRYVCHTWQCHIVILIYLHNGSINGSFWLSWPFSFLFFSLEGSGGYWLLLPYLQSKI